MRTLLKAIPILSLLLASACSSDVVWCSSQSVERDGWSPLKSVEFSLTQKDSTLWQSKLPYSGVLSLRYSDRCPDSRIRLLVERESLQGISRPDTIEIVLFNPDGTPATDPANNPLIPENLKSVGEKPAIGIYQKSAVIFEDEALSPMMRIAVTPLENHPIEGISHATMLIR